MACSRTRRGGLRPGGAPPRGRGARRPRSRPRHDAGRDPAARAGRRRGLRERGGPHDTSRPSRPPSTPSCRSRCARRSRRAARAGIRSRSSSRPASPARWLRASITPAADEATPRGRQRRDGAPPPRVRATGLRDERLPRAEDAGGHDPSRGRDAPPGGAGRPVGGPAVRRPARARGGAPVEDRRGPARPLAAGIRQRARRGGLARRGRARGGAPAGGGGRPRRRERGGPGVGRAARPRLPSGPRAPGPEPDRQRDPIQPRGGQGDGRHRADRRGRDPCR